MSDGNVEQLRTAIAAFNRRDGAHFDGLLTADAEIVPVRAALEGTTYRGRDVGSQYCAAVEATWESLSWEVEEIRDVGDSAVALGHIRGSGRESGATIDTAAGWVARFRNGLIAGFRTYTDRNEALKAVGLNH
jgi:ketosteroid isomerase-like protein